MTDLTPPDINHLELMHPVFPTVWNRAFNGYYTVSGGAVTQSGTPDMKSNLASGWKGFINGVYTEVAATDATHDAADGSNDRIDIVYITAAGAYAIHKGTAAATSAADPDDPTNWHKFISPYPADSIPAGVILALVRIPAAATTVTTANIWEIGVKQPLGIGRAVSEVPYDDADGKVTLLTMPANGFIRFVGKVVTTAYDDGSVTVGEEGDESNLMDADLVDAQGSVSEPYSPDAYYASGSVIKAFITPGSASQGTFTLILEYVTV